MAECDDCECKDTVLEDSECMGEIFEYKNAKCFSWQSLLTAMVCALRDIAAAIREFIASQPVIVAQGVIHYTLTGYGNIVSAACASIQLFTSPLTFEVIGIGVSYLGVFGSQGIYTTDDKIRIKLWNFTTNSQIGENLEVDNLVKFAQLTNGGDTVGSNIAQGNIVGVKICYVDTEGSTYTEKDFDIFLFVKPLELQS